MSVIVYGAEDCSRCRMTEQILKSRGVPFEARMVEDYPEVKENLIKANKLELPYVRVENRVGDVYEWHGFRIDNIKALDESFCVPA